MSSNFKEKNLNEPDGGGSGGASSSTTTDFLNSFNTNNATNSTDQQSSLINSVFEQLQKFKDSMTQKGELELLKEKIMLLEQRNSELEKKLSSSSNLNNSSSSSQSKENSLNESLNDDSIVLTKQSTMPQQQSTPILINPTAIKPSIQSSSLNSIPNINQGGFIITSSGAAILVPPMNKNSCQNTPATTSTQASSSSNDILDQDALNSINSNIDLNSYFKTSPNKLLKSSPVKQTQSSQMNSNLNPTAFIISNGQLVPVIAPNNSKIPIQPSKSSTITSKKILKPKQVKPPKPPKSVNLKPNVQPVIAPAPAPIPVLPTISTEPKLIAPNINGVKKPREIRPKPSQNILTTNLNNLTNSTPAAKIAIQPVSKTISLVTPIKLNTEVESNDILSKAASMIFSPNEFQTLNTLSPNNQTSQSQVTISPNQVNTLLAPVQNTQEQFTIVPIQVTSTKQQPIGKVPITRNPKKILDDNKKAIKSSNKSKENTNKNLKESQNLNLIDTNLVANFVADLDAALLSSSSSSSNTDGNIIVNNSETNDKKDRSKSPELIMSMPTLEQFFDLEPNLNNNNNNNNKNTSNENSKKDKSPLKFKTNSSSSPKKKILPKLKENENVSKLKFETCDLDKVLDQLDNSVEMSQQQPNKQKDFLLDLLEETAQNLSSSSDKSSDLSLTNIAIQKNESKNLQTPLSINHTNKKPSKIAPKPHIDLINKNKVKATSLSDSDDNDDLFDLLGTKNITTTTNTTNNKNVQKNSNKIASQTRTPLKPDNHQTVKKRGRPPKPQTTTTTTTTITTSNKNNLVPKSKPIEKIIKSDNNTNNNKTHTEQNDDENSNFLTDTFQELIEQKKDDLKCEPTNKQDNLLNVQNLIIEEFNNFEYDLAVNNTVNNTTEKIDDELNDEEDTNHTEELTIASLTSKNLNRKRSRVNLVQKNTSENNNTITTNNNNNNNNNNNSSSGNNKVKRVKVDENESDNETDLNTSGKSINEPSENGEKRKRGRPKSIKKVNQSGPSSLLPQNNIEYAGLTRFEIPFEEDPFSETVKNENNLKSDSENNDEPVKKPKLDMGEVLTVEGLIEKMEKSQSVDQNLNETECEIAEKMEENQPKSPVIEEKDEIEHEEQNYDNPPAPISQNVDSEKSEFQTSQFNWDNSNQPSHYDLENDPILNNDLQLIHSNHQNTNSNGNNSQTGQVGSNPPETRTQIIKNNPIIMTPPSTVSSVSSISSISTQNQQSLSINPSSTSSSSSTQMISPVSLTNNNENLQQRSSSVEPNYNQNFQSYQFYNQNFYNQQTQPQQQQQQPLPPVNTNIRNSSPQLINNYQQQQQARPNSVLNTSQSPQANRVSVNSTPTPTTPTPQLSTTPTSTNFNTNLNRSKSNSNSNLVTNNNNNNNNTYSPNNVNSSASYSNQNNQVTTSLQSSKSFDQTNAPTISFMHKNNSQSQFNPTNYPNGVNSSFATQNYPTPTTHHSHHTSHHQIYPQTNNYLQSLQIPGLNHPHHHDPFSSLNKNLSNLPHLNHFPTSYNDFMPTLPPLSSTLKPSVPAPVVNNPAPKNPSDKKQAKKQSKTSSQTSTSTKLVTNNNGPVLPSSIQNPTPSLPPNYQPNKYDSFLTNPVTNALHNLYANSLFPKQQQSYPSVIPNTSDAYNYQKNAQNELFYGQNNAQNSSSNRTRQQQQQQPQISYPNPPNYSISNNTTTQSQTQNQAQHQSRLYQHQQYQQISSQNTSTTSNNSSSNNSVQGVNFNKTNNNSTSTNPQSSTSQSRSSSQNNFESTQQTLTSQRTLNNTQNLYLNQNGYTQQNINTNTQSLNGSNQVASNNQQYRFPGQNGTSSNLYSHSTHPSLAHHLNPALAAAAAFNPQAAAMTSYLANQFSVPQFQWPPHHTHHHPTI